MNLENNQNKEIEKAEISIRELFFLIKNQYKKIIQICLLFFCIGILYIGSIRPTYTSEGSIIVEEQGSSISSIFDMGISADMNSLENEIEVLKSRTTYERTIKSLLNSKHKNNLHLFNTKKFNDGILRKFLRNILFLDWNKKTSILSQNEINDSLLYFFVNKLKADIKITNKRNTDVLKISYSSYDPIEAAIIVNKIIDIYQMRDQEWATGEMSHLKDFLFDQLKIKESELNEIEQKLKVFQEKEHIYGLDDNSNLLLNQLTAIESDFYNTEAKKNILLERKIYFENQLNENEKDFAKRVTNTLNVQLYSIRQELASLESDYISTNSREGASHPAVIKLDNKIKNLKNVLKNKTKNFLKQDISVANPIEYRQSVMDSVITFEVRISGYNSKLLEVKTLISKYESQLSSLPDKYLEFSRYQRENIILNETYMLMKQKLEEVKINEASQLGKIKIVDSAISKPDQTFPNKKVILFIFLFFGLGFSITFVLIKEFLDSTIKSIEEIERRGLDILAIIPSIGQTEQNRKKKKKGYNLNLKLSKTEKLERRLLTHEDPKSPISEAYRSLRTSLMFHTDKKTCKIILVSSPGPGEGKTTTVANLAITYANMGKKTLLLDSDLRKPVIHNMFKNMYNEGLTHYLTNSEKNINNIICKTEVENLSIVSSGVVPPNPSELLASELMNNFIDHVKNEFDIILIDTPPLIAVTDAFILTKYVDKFLLVIRASVTQKGALERSMVNMVNMNNQIDGVVFNGVDDSSTYGGGYYYNYYQYYASNEEK